MSKHRKWLPIGGATDYPSGAKHDPHCLHVSSDKPVCPRCAPVAYATHAARHKRYIGMRSAL